MRVSLLAQTKHLSNGTEQGKHPVGKAPKIFSKNQMDRELTLQPC